MKIVCALISLIASQALAFTATTTPRSLITLKAATVGDEVEAPVEVDSTEVAPFDIDSVFGITIESGLRCPPLGRYFIEQETGDLRWWQNAELKHARVCMAATIGWTVQKTGTYFGGSGDNAWYISKSEGVTFEMISAAKTPFEALNLIPAAGLLQIAITAGIVEVLAQQYHYDQDAERVPGDYGWDPLNYVEKYGGFGSDKMNEMRMRELKNGRLAMLTITAWVANENMPGALPFWHP
mmetsp:Transcript_26103/g.29856  ORF Transcript_26103/g.29856 Transcript_26103/m.29856 type:complete len:239 (-) Transcript_26103:180-896(-)|eukprot:CAMPEP_0194139850 /NCGR_PEP_ID=MMETSP0152-20130528/9445_1 /TAXON_ID=1049557 /ORGANISM="Thalassiothrix antarctica, Strain L6-D1" /LENGTH=238 /DNA_ID=CAMNT_0038837827 /DNA_START=110 /DNA_END=826 /DNA_ORIENTATION=+